MFDLDQAILRWTNSFQVDSAIDATGLAEIETHLRETIENLQTRGLSEQEAFMVAAQRLGHTTELEAEFAKVQPLAVARRRLVWVLGGYVTITLCGALISALSSLATAGLAQIGVPPTTSAAAVILFQLAAWIASLALLYVKLQSIDLRNNHFSIKTAMLLGTLLVLMPVVSAFGKIVQTRAVDPTWIGESALWLGVAAATIHLFVCFASLIAMCRFSEPTDSVVE